MGIGPIIAAVVTGIFGLIGGFIGARLGRQSEYEKWLRQERNTAFGRFLLKMKDFQSQALDLVIEIQSTKDDDQRIPGIRLSELKWDFEIEESIVRFYLAESDRDSFSKAIKEFLDAYDPAVKKSRMTTVERVTKEIRDLFEKVLHSNK